MEQHQDEAPPTWEISGGGYDPNRNAIVFTPQQLGEMQLNKKEVWSARMTFHNVKMPYRQQILDACDAIFPHGAATGRNGVAYGSMGESPASVRVKLENEPAPYFNMED